MSIIGALISALGFGTANIVIKKSLSNLSIPQTLMMSTLSGAFFLFILTLFRGFGSDLGTIVTFAAIFAVFEVGLYLTLYKAFEESNLTVASAVITSYPILSTIFTVFFLNQQVAPIKFAFVGLMVVGAIVVSIDWNKVLKDGFNKSDLVKGLPWIIISTLVHAVYFPLLGEFTASGDWEAKLFFIKVFSTIVIFILFFVIKKQSVIPPKNLIPFTSLLGLLEVIGWAGYSWATSTTEGKTAILIAILNSSVVITAILAFFILKERISKFQYIGIVLVFVSLVGLSL